MSKSNRKQAKKQNLNSNVSALTLLRPRLDGLLKGDLSDRDRQALYGDLDTVVQDVKADFFLQVLLKAYRVAPSQTQAKLDDILPDWLSDRGYLEALKGLVDQHKLDSAEEQIALGWLQASGVDTSITVEESQDDFYSAYVYADEFGSQATLNIFWYKDRQHRRVQGFNFLIDYNPPWEGAVKDIMLYPSRAPQQAVRDFVGLWERQFGASMTQISAQEAKQRVLKALESNRTQKIRLSRDLIANRESFTRYILTLPDGPDTPAFTNEDFDALSRLDKTAESIMSFEQNVGRRVRMDDGKEVFFVGDPLEDF